MRIEQIDTCVLGADLPQEHELMDRLSGLPVVFPLCPAASERSAGSIELNIGVAGHAGHLRSIIRTQSMLEAVHVIEALRALGYHCRQPGQAHGQVHRMYAHVPQRPAF